MLIKTLSVVLLAALVGAAPQHQLEARTHEVSVEKATEQRRMVTWDRSFDESNRSEVRDEETGPTDYLSP
ncbi:hypothetical protein E4U14_003590 [Claviceps sp. LM454 group G7]|nr:hypothetical protein E4U14_003590 [Claviceps sp. LM454 group G7]